MDKSEFKAKMRATAMVDQDWAKGKGVIKAVGVDQFMDGMITLTQNILDSNLSNCDKKTANFYLSIIVKKMSFEINTEIDEAEAVEGA